MARLRDADVPQPGMVTFPDFVRDDRIAEFAGMGNGGQGCDYMPAGKNCFDEWVSEPAAIAPPRRGPGRPRKDKYSQQKRKPVAAVISVTGDAEPDDETEMDADDFTPDAKTTSVPVVEMREVMPE